MLANRVEEVNQSGLGHLERIPPIRAPVREDGRRHDQKALVLVGRPGAGRQPLDTPRFAVVEYHQEVSPGRHVQLDAAAVDPDHLPLSRRVCVPQVEPLPGGREDEPAVWREGDGPHPLLMAHHILTDLFARVDVPQPGGSILPHRHQLSAVRAESHRADDRPLIDRLPDLTSARVPALQLPAGPGHQPGTAGADFHALDALVPELNPNLAGGPIPEPYVAVSAGRHDQFAVRAEAGAQHCGRVCHRPADRFVRAQVPDQDGPRRVPGVCEPGVRAEARLLHRRSRPPDAAEQRELAEGRDQPEPVSLQLGRVVRAQIQFQGPEKMQDGAVQVTLVGSLKPVKHRPFWRFETVSSYSTSTARRTLIITP